MSAEDFYSFLDSEEFETECEKIFNQYDADASGFFDKKELRISLEDLSNALPVKKGTSSFPVTDKDVGKSSMYLSTDHENKISLEEFTILARLVFLALLAGKTSPMPGA